MKMALVIICLFQVSLGHATDRLLMNVKINGQPVRLAFDTGASGLMLTRKAAERLGLKVSAPLPDARLKPGAIHRGTADCDLELGKTRIRISSSVVDLPDYLGMDVDGLLGWKPFSKDVLWIDAAAQTVTRYENVPEEAAGWLKLRVSTNFDILALETMPFESNNPVVIVDTGWDSGVSLPPQTWLDWKAAHAKQPTTLNACYMPGTGVVVKEEGWARELAFGPLVLAEVPVMEASSADMAQGSSRYEATLGLTALKRLDMVVDGRQGIAYVRLKQVAPPPYEHNRLGAVFVPADPQSDDLQATVLEGGPAYKAGIRSGDVLLRVGTLDVTKWRTDPGVLPLSRFFQLPAGTKLDLILRRDGKTLEARPVLRQILPPKKK